MCNPCIHVYCGNGKGKTTAAVGQAIRACGAGFHCEIYQFLKNGQSSEVSLLKKNHIPVFSAETFDTFIWNMTPKQKTLFFSAQYQLFLQARQSIGAATDLIVLDEILDACDLGILSHRELSDTLSKNSHSEIILTGRDGSFFLKQADYYTEMREIKHPYHCGAKARKGIEY